MKKLYILLIPFVIASCLRIDDLAFVNDNTIEKYYFDEYDGEYEIEIPDTFKIDKSFINLLTLESQMEGETEPLNIYGVYLGNLNTIKSDTVILYLHGQTDHMDYYWTRAKLLYHTGFPVFMIDYRGFGLSEGSPTEKGMYADTKAAMEWLRMQDAKHVVLYGFSLGSAPATFTAPLYQNYFLDKLILESPFSSAGNIAQESTIINISPEFLTNLQLNNGEWIKNFEGSLMWMHGTADDYLKISNGEIIYKNHNGTYKEAHRIEGAKHGKDGVPETWGFWEYLGAVKKFIREH